MPKFLTFKGRFSLIWWLIRTLYKQTYLTATYHVQADDLSVGLLDLAELHQEVPKTRLCDNSVGCKDSHPVQLWRGVGLGWQMAANDLVFRKTTYKFKSVTFSLMV